MTGIPLRTALPDSGSSTSASVSRLEFTPGGPRPPRAARPSRSWPQPWGRLTTPGVIPSVTSNSASPRRPGTRPGAPRRPGRARGIVGVDLQGAAVLTLDEHLDVVHPRVVRSHVASADQHQRRRRRDRGERPADPCRRRIVGGQLDLARRGAQQVGEPGSSGRGRRRAGWPRASSSVRPSGSAPNQSPYGPVRSMRSSRLVGPTARRTRRQQLVGVASARGTGPSIAACRANVGGIWSSIASRSASAPTLATGPAAQQDLPLLGLAVGWRTAGASSWRRCAPRS